MAEDIGRHADRVLAQAAKKVNAKLQRIIKESTPPIVRAMDEISADLLQRSTDLAPILIGELIGSARVRKQTTKHLIRRVVAFGTGHAVIMHEGTYQLGPISSRKPGTKDGPVGRKYLERPYRRHKGRYVDHVKNAAREGVGISDKRAKL